MDINGEIEVNIHPYKEMFTKKNIKIINRKLSCLLMDLCIQQLFERCENQRKIYFRILKTKIHRYT